MTWSPSLPEKFEWVTCWESGKVQSSRKSESFNCLIREFPPAKSANSWRIWLQMPNTNGQKFIFPKSKSDKFCPLQKADLPKNKDGISKNFSLVKTKNSNCPVIRGGQPVAPCITRKLNRGHSRVGFSIIQLCKDCIHLSWTWPQFMPKTVQNRAKEKPLARS